MPRGHRRFRSVVATLGALALATVGATLGAGTAAAAPTAAPALPVDTLRTADVQVELQTPFFTAGGTDVTTTVTVTNVGPDDLLAVGTSLMIPPGYTVVDNGGGSAIEGSVGGVDWFLRTLGSGVARTFTVILTAPPGAGVAVTGAYAFAVT
ncbi:MAG: hypothetical protein ACXVGI_03330, partial [Mycobacteriaceae bacterium]